MGQPERIKEVISEEGEGEGRVAIAQRPAAFVLLAYLHLTLLAHSGKVQNFMR